VEHGVSIERVPQQPKSPESGLKTGAERHEQSSEPTAVVADTNGLIGVFPTPVARDQSVTDDSAATSVPAIANDDDLIEREWVDRAKKIVADTRDDPYKQEQAVTELQKDYQKKRYGRKRGGA
jgi:hypothetical protein